MVPLVAFGLGKERLSAWLLYAVRPMMYGYGDAQEPLQETVDLVEVSFAPAFGCRRSPEV